MESYDAVDESSVRGDVQSTPNVWPVMIICMSAGHKSISKGLFGYLAGDEGT
jgi:hypothetical protein